MGLPFDCLHGAIRFSCGVHDTEADVADALDAVRAAVEFLRATDPAGGRDSSFPPSGPSRRKRKFSEGGPAPDLSSGACPCRRARLGMSKILLWAKNLAFLLAFLWILFTAGFLQEFARDRVPEAAAAKEVALPLKDPWLMVRLQRGTMYLMDGEVPVKGYDIGSGEGAPGRAGVRGRGTPLGEFTVANKLKREDIWRRGSRFMPFHYPREADADWAYQGGLIESEDYHRILDALRSGEPVPVDTPLGGPLGIQGNYFFFHTRRFTDGSIALSNSDLNELFDYVQPGMRVVIEDY